MGWVDVDCLLQIGIDHPEHFLDVIGHLMKLPLAFFKEGPCLLFGPVHLTENVGQQEGEDKHTSDQRNQQRNGYESRFW